MKYTKKSGKTPEKTSTSSNIIEKSNKYGVIKIYENVIVEVIKKAAYSVDGVTRLSGGTLVESIANLIGSQKILDRAIVIKIDKNILTAEVKVNMLYGEHIPEVAARVQNTVSEEVKRITGLTVGRIDVIIQEIENNREIEKPELTE